MMTINRERKKIGIYVHIPFCVRKCRYCGFLSYAADDRLLYRKYTEHLIKEIRGCREKLHGLSADTVFIGGGTPSLLSCEDIDNILEALRTFIDIEEGAEITMEANPGTLGKEKLYGIRKSGINRLSIGVQSFDEEILKTLGRIHSADDAVRMYELSRRAGFENINLDLMFAVPGHTGEIFADSMKKAAALSPEHISFYSLQLEEGTPMYEDYRIGKVDLPGNVHEKEMYENAVYILKGAGYRHYEISNAAKPGYCSRHNMKYWNMGEYIGFGAGAHSFLLSGPYGVRYRNTEELREYFRLLEEGKSPVDKSSIKRDGRRDSMGVFSFTALRTSKGIDFEKFREFYGASFSESYSDIEDTIDRYIKEGFLEKSDNHLRLTLKGISVSNSIMCEFV